MTKTIKKAAKGAKKAVRRSNKTYAGDRIGQIVAILATIMAGSYVVLRIIGWVRFTGV